MKKRLFLALVGVALSLCVGAQDLTKIKRANKKGDIPVALKQTIIGGDTTYMQQYKTLETRNDSICWVNDTCIALINAVNSFTGLQYDTVDLQFEYSWVGY